MGGSSATEKRSSSSGASSQPQASDSLPSSSSKSLAYADVCVQRGILARDSGDFDRSLLWFEEGLRIRHAIVGKDLSSSYQEGYVSALIQIGEVYYWKKNSERALAHFLRANHIIDPLMDQVKSIGHSTAVSQFVNLTAGFVLVYSRLFRNLPRRDVACTKLLGDTHPLDLAESQLHRAIQVVTFVEGGRSNVLISLYHMQARVLLMREKHMLAFRTMQRCLGLTLHVAQSKRLFSFLSYTKNVLEIIKIAAEKERAALLIQEWWRDIAEDRGLTVRKREEVTRGARQSINSSALADIPAPHKAETPSEGHIAILDDETPHTNVLLGPHHAQTSRSHNSSDENQASASILPELISPSQVDASASVEEPSQPKAPQTNHSSQQQDQTHQPLEKHGTHRRAKIVSSTTKHPHVVDDENNDDVAIETSSKWWENPDEFAPNHSPAVYETAQPVENQPAERSVRPHTSGPLEAQDLGATSPPSGRRKRTTTGGSSAFDQSTTAGSSSSSSSPSHHATPRSGRQQLKQMLVRQEDEGREAESPPPQAPTPAIQTVQSPTVQSSASAEEQGSARAGDLVGSKTQPSFHSPPDSGKEGDGAQEMLASGIFDHDDEPKTPPGHTILAVERAVLAGQDPTALGN